MSNPRIHLQLGLAQAGALFERVLQGAHSPSQALAGLNALALLLGSHTDELDQRGQAYADIRALLSGYLEQARERLLGEQAALLGQGLVVIDPAMVARVHATLSREAFFQAVARCGQDLPAERLASLRGRVQAWCVDAERRARDASPYPDAMDWQAAGILAGEYLAMQDLRNALKLLA
jgi:hypothetical protein